MLVTPSSVTERLTYEEAMTTFQSPNVIDAMQTKVCNFQHHQIGEFLQQGVVLSGENVISTRCLHQLKNSSGHKTIFIIQGWKQKPGIDYLASLTQVCRMTSLKAFAGPSSRM